VGRPQRAGEPAGGGKNIIEELIEGWVHVTILMRYIFNPYC
jgi:hypothetical protein